MKKQPKIIKEIAKEVLDKVKILQENQPKEDKFSKEIVKFTSNIQCNTIETQLNFNPYTI